MRDNVISKIVVNVDKDVNKSQLCEILMKPVATNYDKIYSYLIYAKYNETILDGWTVEYNVSQSNEYNTINTDDAIIEIAITILNHRKSKETSYVIGYKQPDITLMCKLYEPYIKKLASEQKQHWPYLEYEDLCQMCRLVMITLYKKGYYLHKSLLEKSFINYVLMHIKSQRNKPVILSLDDTFSKSEGNDDITFADTIPDMQELYERQDKEDEEEKQELIKQKREIVITIVGSRVYDQLVREYGNSCTTGSGVRTVQRIKEKLRKEGVIRRK